MNTLYIVKDKQSLTAITDRHGTIKADKHSGVSLNEAEKLRAGNGLFFEAAFCLQLLDNPRDLNIHIDDNAHKLAKIFHTALTEPEVLKNIPAIYLREESNMADVINKELRQLLPSSEQVGRQPENHGELSPWLLKTLSSPSENHQDILTKMKTLGLFGSITWALMNPDEEAENPEKYAADRSQNQQGIQQLFQHVGLTSADQLNNRFQEFKQKTRAPVFDSPVSRARAERPKRLEDSAQQGTHSGVPRENQPILNTHRPFLMSEQNMQNMPEAYREFGIEAQLAGHELEHNPGINKWQGYGSFIHEALQYGLPASAAHAGSGCDQFFAAHILGEEPLYGDADRAEAMALAIALFMNYSGHHSLAEVFPIGESISHNRPYVATNQSERTSNEHLYDRVLRAAARYTSPETVANLQTIRKIHAQEENRLLQQYPALRSTPEPTMVEFHATEQQMQQWKENQQL